MVSVQIPNKVVFKILAVVTFLVLSLGFICPYLVSQSSDTLVACGLLLGATTLYTGMVFGIRAVNAFMRGE